MNHDRYMLRALELAAKGHTSPNPMVGAVVVKDNQIVGEGFHPAAGKPHAEVFALSQAGELASGSTVYVTLEPCNHFGRTPPCTEALISAGVAEVYIGMLDPDPRVSGVGVAKLEASGIRCQVLNDLEPVCRKLNESYIKHRTTGLPFVTLKSALSLDGRVATRTGDSKWITSEKARAYAHRYRSQVDAIMVGANTIRIDDPSLSARTPAGTCYPTRVVVSESGDVPASAKVFSLPGDAIVALGRGCRREKVEELKQAGARIIFLDDARNCSITVLLAELAKLGILSVLVEGGGTLAASCLNERVVDKIMYYYAPKIIGGTQAVAAVGGSGVDLVSEAPVIENVTRRRLGDDLLIEGYVKYQQSEEVTCSQG